MARQPFKWFGQTEALSDPGDDSFPIVKSDTQKLSDTPKYLYIGTGGTLVLKFVEGGPSRTFLNVPDGSWVPMRPMYVMAATTCSDMQGIL